MLIVEDDPALLSLLRLSLEQAGYEVATAPSARAAALLIADRAFDLALLDLMLPDGAGRGRGQGPRPGMRRRRLRHEAFAYYVFSRAGLSILIQWDSILGGAASA